MTTVAVMIVLVPLCGKEKGNNEIIILTKIPIYYRTATNNMIEPDDIVITEIAKTNNGLRVTFYIKRQFGTPVDANAVVAAVKAS